METSFKALTKKDWCPTFCWKGTGSWFRVVPWEPWRGGVMLMGPLGGWGAPAVQEEARADAWGAPGPAIY